MKSLFLPLAFFLSLLCFNSAQATHVSGAEIGWKHLGNHEYAITVYVYHDCNGSSLNRTPITVSSNCSTEKKLAIPKNATDVLPVCDKQCNTCENRGCSFRYGIQKYELTTVFDLSSYVSNGCCEFTVSWGDCCRTGNISTGAANQNMHLQASFNACQYTDVQWNKTKSPIICIGRDLSLNHSISTGSASDSIVYSLTSPLTEAGKPVTYSSGYSADKFLYYLGFPKTGLTMPRGMHFNSSTGLLQFRPMKVEVGVGGFKAEVYRNGKKIAETMRDMQFIIIKCPDNHPPVLSGFDGKFSKASYSKVVCSGQTSKFLFKSFDEEDKDTTKIEFGGGIGDSIVTDTSSAHAQAYWYWTPDTSNITGIYQNFSLTAIDNACPVNGRTQQVYRVKVVEPTTIKPRLTITAIDSCGQFAFEIRDKNNLPISAKWSVNNETLEGDSVALKMTEPGRHVVKATIEGCSSIEIIDTFFVINAYKLKSNLNDTTFCATEVVLAPNIKGAIGQLNYNWTITDGLNYKGATDESSLLLNLKSLSGLIDQHISLKLEDSLGCKLEKSISIKIKSSNTSQIASGSAFCENTNKQIQLNTFNGNGNWYGNGVEKNIINIEKLQPGKHTIRFVFESPTSCVVDTAIFIIHDRPDIEIDHSLNTCVGADEISLSADPHGGNWSGSGISGSTFNPNIAGKGEHKLVYWITNASNCPSQDTMVATVHDYIPNVTITNLVSACEYEQDVELSATKDGGTWSGNGVLSTLNPLKLSPSNLNLGENQIAYEYTDSNNCSLLDTSIIVINVKPNASFTMSQNYMPKGDTLNAVNTTVDTEDHNYLWLIGNPAVKIEKTTNLNTTIDSLGIFDIELLATHKSAGCTDTFTLENAIEVGTVGINNVSQLKTLYPNPASTFINLPIEDEQVVEYSIISINGKIHDQGQVIDAQHNVADLPSGIYILQLNNGAKTAHYLFNKN